MNSVADLSDVNLDAAFAASFSVNDTAAILFYGAEIRERLTSPLSFVGGLFGQERFPLYTARVGFSQTGAARDSVADSAVAVGDVLKVGGFTAALFALATVAVYAAVK